MRSSSARSGRVLDLTLFMLALLTLAAVANILAQLPAARLRVDATRTRAYSLSEQTRQLLDGLDGDWSVALVQVVSETDPSVREQVMEVLRRYRKRAPRLDVVTIDPTDPASLDAYEALIDRLRGLEAEAIGGYDAAIARGLGTFESLLVFAQQQSAQLEPVVRSRDGADAAALRQHLAPLALLAREGSKVVDAVTQALEVSETRPIPDYETARVILATGLAQWADELDASASIYDQLRTSDDPVLASLGRAVGPAHAEMSVRLVEAADPLDRLGPLEIARIGRALETGEAAIVIGPESAAVIPGAQLFPRLNVRAVGDAVAFDRRFRGEQVISAAIRSLTVPHMPLVVFVHAENRSLLRESPQAADVRGVAEQLSVSRMDVREWSVGNTERPVPRGDQPVVWVVVPPQQRAGLELEASELGLVRATRGLLDDGAAVLLSVHPSLLPRYRQRDPWAALAEPFGLRPATGEAIFESVQMGESFAVQGGISIDTMTSSHPIAQAVTGQQLFLGLPVPLEWSVAPPPGVTTDVIVDVEPNPRRWREADWATMMSLPEGPAAPPTPLDTAVAAVVAAERPNPVGPGRQRLLLVGSGGWMLSYVADAYASIGGERVALQNPGNAELMLSGVAWLAGMDDLIAPSPVTRQASRLEGLDGAAQLHWGLISIVGVPFGCLLLGAGVGLVRRVR